MKLRFVGTGAADWEKEHPSRGYASVLIGENILVDCGLTVIPALTDLEIDVRKITDILVTHSHIDHFNLDTLRFLFENRNSDDPIRLWGSVEVIKQAEFITGNTVLCPLSRGDTFAVGTLKITALEANHTTDFPSEKALHYFFETPENHTLFYALDGAWFLKPTWQFLCERKIDFIVWDCTIGDTMGDWRIFEHNSIDMIKVMTQTFRKQGVFSNETQIILSHMARTLCSPHEQLQKKIDSLNFKLAFDGMSLEI